MSSVREFDDDEEAELIDDPELDAELEAGIEEIERGEWVDGDEVLRRLRNGEYDAPPDRRATR
jgi:predicted transcriptional regulator